jgi:hypothetical protein
VKAHRRPAGGRRCGCEQNETAYCVLLDLLLDDELVPESAVGPLVLLPELLFPAVPPAVLPLFAPVLPPPDGLEVDPEEFAVDPDGLDEFDDADLPALDDPDWLAWLLRSVHAAKPNIVATIAAEIT